MISSENKMNPLIKFLFLIVLLSGLAVSCDDPVPEPDPEPEKQKAPALTIKINEFIEAVMTDVYLWYDKVPAIDIRYEFDSKAYFDKLLVTEDKWSFVSDDVKKLEDSFEGKETSYGWSLAFGRFSDTKNIFALVEFVYPNTPADKAGAKRGDLIYEMNGAAITDNNYRDLLSSDNLTFTYGQYGAGGITNTKTGSMVALELNLDPVQFTNIIEHGGRKIGYLFYAQFIANYNASLDAALQYFLDNQITDLVLDYVTIQEEQLLQPSIFAVHWHQLQM
jgi:carboxyl-terminal processing protease